MNSEELTHKAEEEIAALISKKVAEIEFAPRETMKGLEGYHVKIKLL